MSRLDATYILPLRLSADEDISELTSYLAWLYGRINEVIVVDGSDPEAFAAHAGAWPFVRHLPPRPDLVTPNGDLMGLALLVGRDTLSLRDWDFTPSVESLEVTSGSAILTLQALRGELGVSLTYRFTPDNYMVSVDGQVTGLGPNGGTLLFPVAASSSVSASPA